MVKQTTQASRKELVLQQLAEQQDTLKTYAVKALFLFGSVARGEATPDSDVDLLVEFEKPVGLLTFVGLKQYLEELLECPVDLGTPNSLKPHVKENAMRDAIRAF